MHPIQYTELYSAAVTANGETTLANRRTGQDGILSSRDEPVRVTRVYCQASTAPTGYLELLIDGASVSTIDLSMVHNNYEGLECDIPIPVGSKLQVIVVEEAGATPAVGVTLQLRPA